MREQMSQSEHGSCSAWGVLGRRGALAGLVAGVALLLGLAPAAGQEAHFDILLFDDGSGNVRAGAVDVDFLTPEPGTRVVEGEAFGDTTAPTPTFTGEDPGFFSFSDGQASLLPPPFDNLPGNAAITLDFLTEPTLGRSLSYWDDFAGNWVPVPNSETISFSFGATNFGAVDGTSEVLGVSLGDTSGTGFLDDHPDYDLGAATPGAYLLYGRADVAGLSGPSNPFWLVLGTLDECEETDSCNAAQEFFNEDIEEQIEAAIDFTNVALAPEPGTLALLAGGLVGLAAFARRRR